MHIGNVSIEALFLRVMLGNESFRATSITITVLVL